jgi:translation initiation factor 3 subunit A
LAKANPALKSIYDILESNFNPLELTSLLAPHLAVIAADAILGKYLKPLQNVVLTRLVTSLGGLYTRVSIASLVGMVEGADASSIESFILERRLARVDHATQSIYFEEEAVMALETIDLCERLDEAGKLLYQAAVQIKPEVGDKDVAERKAAILKAVEGMEEIRKENAARVLLISKRKEERDALAAEKEREDAIVRIRNQAEAQEAEKIRVAEETLRRENDKIKAHRAEIERQEKIKLTSRLAQELEDKNLKIKGDLTAISPDKLLELQHRQLERERLAAKQKVRLLVKRHDHLERAFKKEEISLLENDYERQKIVDADSYKTMVETTKTTARQKYDYNMKVKARLLRIRPDCLAFRKEIDAKRETDYKERLAIAQKSLAEEMAARLLEVREKEKVDLAERIELEEKEKGLKEAADLENAAREERERVEAEKKEKDREEFDERRRKLDEQAQLQRERDERAEEKIRASRGDTSDRREQVSASGRAIPGSARAPASAAPVSRYVLSPSSIFRIAMM